MKIFVLRRALAVAEKEIYHILRDPFTLGAALGLPLFMVLFFGLAIEFNVKNIPLAVYDLSSSQSSRRLIDTFSSSQYFIPKKAVSDRDAIEQISSETVRAALIIPANFERDILADRVAGVQLLLDGSDSSTVAPILGYISNIRHKAQANIADYNPEQSYEIRSRFLFNPELKSRWFIVPGLNVVIMGIISVLLTSLTVAREYESGSMELLLSTPIQPLEIIIGKLAPYGVLGLITIAGTYLIARLIFAVPFVGSHIVFALATILFLLGLLSQGLLISVTTRNQQVAMQLAMMTGMLPNQLLSGFIFPIESMPQIVQYFTMILPARWFMQISRDSFLQGTSFIHLWQPFSGLMLFCLAIIFLTAKKFKRDLE